MKNIMLLPLVLFAFYANAKSWTILYPEEGKWIEQTQALDKDGWPKILNTRVSKKKPSTLKASAINLFTQQNNELKNPNGIKLWDVTNQWDWGWELKFTDWVKAEVDAGWWKKHGMATDCADAIISARWVFARNNGLPMANHLGSGAWFTQNSVKAEWEALTTAPEWFNDKRFLAALNYLLNHTFTHSLWKDSYPVAITPQAILPCGYHLALHDKTGHTQFVYKVGVTADDMPLTTLNSTVPREVRELMEFMFFDNQSDESGRAFMRMRWPVWTGEQVDFVPAERMPQYSREQFAPDFIRSPRTNFFEEVYYRLDPVADYNKIGLKVAHQIQEMFKARIPVVEEGYKVCQAKRCEPGTPEYNAWSTPSRDGRIGYVIQNFDFLMSLVTTGSGIRNVLSSQLYVYGNRVVSVDDLIVTWRLLAYSSDPNDPPRNRWGN